MKPRIAVSILLAIGVVAAIAVVLAKRDSTNLCDSRTALREWRGVLQTAPRSDQRYEKARPVVEALAGCGGPLVGLNASQVKHRLGSPAAAASTRTAWSYDVGLEAGMSYRTLFLITFGRNGKVRDVYNGF